MAFAASGLYYITHRDIYQNDTAVDLLADTLKGALYTDAITAPNFDTNTGLGAAPYTSNQVTGTGYSAGGAALTTVAITVETGSKLTVDAVDLAWTTATFSAVRGVVIYDDTITTPTADPLLCAVTFGADFAVTAGTFTIQWAAPASGGIWNIDLA